MKTVTEPARNETFEKFGGTTTLIHDYQHWSLLTRPSQATLGALILLAHGPAKAFSDLNAAAHAELAEITRDIETRLRKLFGPDKYNYLMLMMVDPHVHFHVLPRYASGQTFQGITFPDPGWPALPDLTATPDQPDAAAIVCQALRVEWKKEVLG